MNRVITALHYTEWWKVTDLWTPSGHAEEVYFNSVFSEIEKRKYDLFELSIERVKIDRRLVSCTAYKKHYTGTYPNGLSWTSTQVFDHRPSFISALIYRLNRGSHHGLKPNLFGNKIYGFPKDIEDGLIQLRLWQLEGYNSDKLDWVAYFERNNL